MDLFGNFLVSFGQRLTQCYDEKLYYSIGCIYA